MGVYKKGKLFGIFNILDILVLLAVLLVIVGLFVRKNLLNMFKVSANGSTIDFTVKIDRVRSFTFDAIDSGDILYDSETGAELGTITDKEKTVYMEHIYLPNGTVVLAPSPDRFSILLTVEGKGNSTADGNFINGNRLVAPNGKISVATKKMNSEGLVMSAGVK